MLYILKKRKKILDIITNEVISSALQCKELDDNIKESVKDTLERLKVKQQQEKL